MGHGRGQGKGGRRVGKKFRPAPPSYNPKTADEYLNDPRVTCLFCSEPVDAVAKRVDMFEYEVYGNEDATMVSCLQCWKERTYEI